jgi:UDP-N-acetylmuramyl pentapeptide phosphotransferase/UDP-N-acetylglucosamine-1-phosphate transferase
LVPRWRIGCGVPRFQPVARFFVPTAHRRKRVFDVNVATAILPAIAALVAAAATAALLHWRRRLPLATRNARSLHTVPIPRVGGLAIWAGFLPVVAVAPTSTALALGVWGVPWLLLAGVSLLDDMRGVAIVPRLSIHALASVWFAVAIAGIGLAQSRSCSSFSRRWLLHGRSISTTSWTATTGWPR